VTRDPDGKPVDGFGAELADEANRQLLAAHDASAKDYPRYQSACHEAGHAVTHWALGVPFDKVDLDREPLPATLPLPGTKTKTGAALMIHAAGGLADMIAQGLAIADSEIIALLRGPGPTYALHDWETGEIRVRPYSIPATSPTGGGRDLDLWIEKTAGKPDAFVVEMYRDCEMLTRSLMPAVHAVAEVLTQRGVLTCDEVGELAAAAMDGKQPEFPIWWAPAGSETVMPALRLYALTDPSQSATAADSSGNGAPPLTQRKYPGLSGHGSLTFGSSTPVIGAAAWGATTSAVTSCLFSPAAAGLASGNTQLEANLATPLPASAGFTFGIMANASNTGVPVCIGDTRLRVSLMVVYTAGWYLGVLSATNTLTSSSTVSGPAIAHLAVTVSGTTATLWVNGASGTTLAVPAGFTARRCYVGGPSVGGAFANVIPGFSGALNAFAVFPSVLTGTQIGHQASAGLNEYQGSTVAAVAARVLAWAGVPAGLQSLPSPGVSYVDAYEINGMTPLSVLQ
jgi:hypothetical protein